MLRVLDLFSGIGGFSLGLERTGGFKTIAFCEIEPFPRKVLAKHWPEVPCYHDVRELTAASLAADGIGVDVICGGFPCQDISIAGKGVGLAGERSGLWTEFARLIGELQPKYAIVENVSALLSRGLADVLGDLASLGYDAEWHCIPASAVGAPHRRDRIWIVAYAGCLSGAGRRETNYLVGSTGARETNGKERQWDGDAPDDCRTNVADAKKHGAGWRQQQPECCEGSGNVADTCCAERSGLFASRLKQELASVGCDSRWSIESDVCRVANGVPSRVDRLKGLGNAVVPQIPELIGRAILAAELGYADLKVA